MQRARRVTFLKPILNARDADALGVKVRDGEIGQGGSDCAVGVMPLATALQHEVACGRRGQLKGRDFVQQFLLAFSGSAFQCAPTGPI